MLLPLFLVVSLAACSGGGGGGGTPAPTPSPAASAAFEPASITVHAASYDYYGVFAYSAASNGQPKPIQPADGALACSGGYSVPLQIRAGPDEIGVVRDQYVVLPLLATPPAGTTLTCTSEWGTYSAAGTLLASTTLNATIVYDQSGTTIAFSPSKATIKASGGNAPIYLDYTSATGFSIAPVSPSTTTLACPNGYAPTTQLHAGPGKSGEVVDQLVIDTASISPPAGTKLACTATYGLYDSMNTLAAQATLAVTLEY